jgi:hypothetical protein
MTHKTVEDAAPALLEAMAVAHRERPTIWHLRAGMLRNTDGQCPLTWLADLPGVDWAHAAALLSLPRSLADRVACAADADWLFSTDEQRRLRERLLALFLGGSHASSTPA